MEALSKKFVSLGAKKVPSATPEIVPQKEVIVSSEDSPFTATERIPSNWHIEPYEDDMIQARNTQTRRVYVGSVAEFNERLRHVE
jgi:hypothetical protein